MCIYIYICMYDTYIYIYVCIYIYIYLFKHVHKCMHPIGPTITRPGATFLVVLLSLTGFYFQPRIFSMPRAGLRCTRRVITAEDLIPALPIIRNMYTVP